MRARVKGRIRRKGHHEEHICSRAPGHVTLRIVDAQGREVRTLSNDIMEPGDRRIEWDGRNARGERVPAGIYVYELRAPGMSAARKLVRLR